jgi:drug/metabolite transporter (DMT)-like permease
VTGPAGSPRTYALDHIGPGAAGLALLTAVLWGGNQVAIKVGLEGMPPLAMAAARFSIGWLVVAVAARATATPVRLHNGEARSLAGLCLVFVLQIAALNIGTLYTTAGRSIVLISAYPFFTALFAHLFIPGDRLSLRQLSGMVLAFAGIVAMFAESLTLADTEYLLGDAIVLLSGGLLGLRQVVIKRLVAGAHPYKVLYWQALASLPVFVVASGLFEAGATYAFSWRAAAGVLYQGIVVAGACFIILVHLLSKHSAGKLGAFGFVTPPVGVALSLWITGDELTAGLLLSMALVAAGVTVSQTGQAAPDGEAASTPSGPGSPR